MRSRVAVVAAALVIGAWTQALGGDLRPQDVQGPLAWGAAKSVHRVGTLYLADQPDRAGLERARKSGVTVVVNVREPEEMAWDERAAAEELGLAYVAVPIAREGPLSEEALERIDAVVEQHAGEEVLVHCSTGNRAAAWLATHLAGERRMSTSDALAVAERAGMTKEDTAAKTREYLQRR